MFRLYSAFLVSSLVSAAPLPVDSSSGSGREPWPVAGADASLIQPGGSFQQLLQVPERGDKEKDAGGDWHIIASCDLFGSTTSSRGALAIEALDPATGEVFASGNATVDRPAPRAAWSPIVSSAQPGSGVEKAFDGDPETEWHSNYQGKKADPPHWIGLEFGKPTRLTTIRYTPRQKGFTNGVARKYRVETKSGNDAWKTVAAGETTNADTRAPLDVTLTEPVMADAFRFVIESDWSGGGFGTAAEIEVAGVKLEKEKPAAAGSRAWLEIPVKLTAALEGKTFGLRVRNTGEAGVVIGTTRLERLHTLPSSKLFGRSNGGLGPDKLGAGLLGFDALTEHQQTTLPVMTVRKGSPASRAGLEEGDVILAVSGKPLPVNDLAPGWNWFERSHEAVLGRETERALQAGSNKLVLTVLRDGAPADLQVELKRNRAFTTMNPADDPAAAALLDDCLRFLIDNQRDDGSWSGDMIRTCYSALALLATGESKYHGKVRKAVRWAQDKYKKPDNYGNLGFWAGAYAGILYSEWHLATGDKTVLKNLDELRDWVVAGQHQSIWDVPALGHGPSGLPYGDKALVAPTCHLLVYEALAQRCGMKSEIWEFTLPYMEMAWSDPKDGGHGALGYNRSYKDTEEFWSRSGLFAIACHLRGERPDMRDAMTSFMTEHHPWIRNSHAYGEPGGSLGLLGLNLARPEAYRSIIRDYAWWFSLAWEPGYGLRFTTPHMGAPYMGEDDLINATYALVLQGPRKSLQITGRTTAQR